MKADFNVAIDYKCCEKWAIRFTWSFCISAVIHTYFEKYAETAAGKRIAHRNHAIEHNKYSSVCLGFWTKPWRILMHLYINSFVAACKHFNLYSLKHFDLKHIPKIQAMYSICIVVHTVCLSDCKPVCLFAGPPFTSAALPFKVVCISCLCWKDVCLKLRGFYLNAVFTFVYSTSIVFVCLHPQQRLLLSIPFFIHCFRLFQSLSFSIYAFRTRCILCICGWAAQWCWNKNEH